MKILRKHRTRNLLGRLTVAIVVSLVVCFSAGLKTYGLVGARAAQSSSDTLIVAIAGTPQGVDDDLVNGPLVWTIAGNVEGFGLQYDHIKYPFKPAANADPNQVPGFWYPDLTFHNVHPGILSSCDLSGDGETVMYHIHHGIRSPYGHELTSADYVWTVRMANATKAIHLFLLQLVGAGNVSQYHVVDRYTVKITSNKPMPYICESTAHIGLAVLDSREAQKHATSSDPWAKNWRLTHDDFFGPYHITDWEAGRQVVMQANPYYLGPKPSIKKIVWLIVPEAANRVALLQSGQIDVAESLSPDEIAFLRTTPSARGVAVASDLDLAGVTNNSTSPFNNKKVRQAVEMAMPRSQMAGNIFRGLAQASEGVLALATPGVTNFHTYGYNLTVAKRLLAQAGYPNGFSTPLSYSAGDPVQEQIAVLMRSALANLGVRVALQPLPPAAIGDLVLGHKATFALWSDGSFLPDPVFGLFLRYPTGAVPNYENYSNSAVDKLITKGSSILNTQQRISFSKSIQEIVHDDAAMTYLVSTDYTIGLSRAITGWNWDPSNFYHIVTMSK